MGQALYRKYRSKGFDDVVGQEHITKTLKQAIKSGRVSHAYLFTGPRGVGKTSVARILAREVNGLPYKGEDIHLDIIEIDGASNRRIDEIRELRDKVHSAPTSAKYKVYIIDEVHMLTREAFNALLKTLEEPPAHCIFILATTEAHKLPETIVSRTQRFEFKPIGVDHVVKRLDKIARAEEIDIEPGALTLLAQHGEGSFRDSIGLLDQLSSIGKKITEAQVQQFLGLPPERLINQVFRCIKAGQPAELLGCLNGMRNQGIGAVALAKSLSENLRQLVVTGNSEQWTIQLLKQLVEVPASHNPEASLEIAALEACLSNASEPISKLKPKPAPAQEIKAVTEKPAEPAETAAPAKPQPPSQAKELDAESWEKILDKVKNQAASLYTALRLADPVSDGTVLTLYFQFPLHQKKVNQARHKDIIGEVVSEILGKNLEVETAVKEKKASSQPTKEKGRTGEQLQTISNIFGQPEVLES